MVAERRTVETTASWVLANLARLTIYLAVASLISAAGLMGWDRSLAYGPTLAEFAAFSAIMFVVGGIGCLPGLAVWLIVLHRIRDAPARSRRTVAVMTAPLVGVIWLVAFTSSGSYLAGLLFGLFWPLGAGFVVRFRREEVRLENVS